VEFLKEIANNLLLSDTEYRVRVSAQTLEGFRKTLKCHRVFAMLSER
jgi:hypothetical protein